MATETALSNFHGYKNNNYETKEIKLTAPILHIGSEVSRLNAFEYVQTSSKVYIPNQEALAQMLYRQGGSFLQDYIKAINERKNIDRLLERAFGEDWQTIRATNGLKVFPHVCTKWTGDSITDLRPMIRNGNGQLYIPGTSIKGAIRTAIAYHLLKHPDRYQVPKNNRVSEIEQQLRQKLNSGRLSAWEQKSLDDRLFMDSLFTDFSLNYHDKTYNPRSGPNTDFLRAVKVSDSQPLVKKTVTKKNGRKVIYNIPIVAEVIVSSHFEEWNAKYKASIYAEMVHNISTNFTITLDKEMLSWFRHRQGMIIPFETVEELIKICEEFAQEQWDGEVGYWQEINNNRDRNKNLDFDLIWDNYYSKPQCPYSLRVGWGSGMTGVTIDWLLDAQIRSDLRDVCGLRAPNFEAPKSRRTIVNPRGDIRYVPGWVKFRV